MVDFKKMIEDMPPMEGAAAEEVAAESFTYMFNMMQENLPAILYSYQNIREILAMAFGMSHPQAEQSIMTMVAMSIAFGSENEQGFNNAKNLFCDISEAMFKYRGMMEETGQIDATQPKDFSKFIGQAHNDVSNIVVASLMRPISPYDVKKLCEEKRMFWDQRFEPKRIARMMK